MTHDLFKPGSHSLGAGKKKRYIVKQIRRQGADIIDSGSNVEVGEKAAVGDVEQNFRRKDEPKKISLVKPKRRSEMQKETLGKRTGGKLKISVQQRRQKAYGWEKDLSQQKRRK